MPKTMMKSRTKKNSPSDMPVQGMKKGKKKKMSVKKVSKQTGMKG